MRTTCDAPFSRRNVAGASSRWSVGEYVSVRFFCCQLTARTSKVFASSVLVTVSDEVRFFPRSARRGTTAKPPASALLQETSNTHRETVRSMAISSVVDADCDGVGVVAGRNDLGGRNRAEHRVIHGEAGADAG